MKTRAKSSAKPPRVATSRAAARNAPNAALPRGAVKGRLPEFTEPCLATLVDAPPEGDEWVHEIKFDGYRIQARIDNGKVSLLTRKGLDWTGRFSFLPRLLGSLDVEQALIDGELVVEDEHGHSSFSALADALKAGHADRFVLHCFDLLHLDGVNFVGASLADRKAALKRLLSRRSKTGPIRYSEHLTGDGALILDEACKLGLEGIVSKRLAAPYHSGRGNDWLKSKCIAEDEFIVIGFLNSNAIPRAIGALVIGYYEKKHLMYAGRVGTGFSVETAGELFRLLSPLRLEKPPVAQVLTTLQRKGVVWVRPELVVEVEYRAWTADNLLRHAAFKGLREDKPAREVERPTVKSR